MSGAPEVLLVDDEPLVLDALRRQHGQRFALATAIGAAAALARVEAGEQFAVVISDFKMPGMDGVQFLERMRTVAPNVVRVMLTGQADVKLATEAVNRGAIFKFLTKPCANTDFARTIAAALEHHRVLVAERRLLEETLAGSVRVLRDILALADPNAFGRAGRVHALAQDAARRLCPEDAWVVGTAATLFQIGLVAVPPDVLTRARSGASLEPGERQVLERVPTIGADLLRGVPRLDAVADLIAHQGARVDGGEVAIGARILSAAIALDELLLRGEPRAAAIAALRAERGRFDPLVLDQWSGAEAPLAEATRLDLSVRDLRPGMALDQDVFNAAGAVIVPRGHELSQATLERLRSHVELGMVREPIRVVVRGVEAGPAASASRAPVQGVRA